MTRVELSEEEIDRIVIAQADDDSAWDEAIRVNGSKRFLASRAKSGKVEQKLLGRLEELINSGEEVLSTRTPPPRGVYGDDSLDLESSIQWATSCLSLLGRVTGKESVYFQNFNSLLVSIPEYSPARKGLGILKAAKDDYEHGYLFETRILIEAEVFDDFLEQAEHLLKTGYFAPAAVLAGSVLEDGLRKLCERTDILIPSKTTIEPMNVELAKAGVYPTLMQKRITALADIRNKSAHGQWDKFGVEDVKQMIAQVRNFMEEFFS